MINLVKGVKITNPDGLEEGYRIHPVGIEAVVDSKNISRVIKNFIKANQGNTLFFFLEVPSSEQGYKDIYYKYGLNSNDALTLFELSEDILVNDGVSAFGFGSKANNLQIGKYSFNTMWLMAQDKVPDNASDIFTKAGIKENSTLTTPADIISEFNPAYTYLYKDTNGNNIFDHLKGLISIGLMRVSTVKA